MDLHAVMELFTWLSFSFGIIGFWLAPRRRYGWLICLCAEAAYLAYGIGTQQYAFVAHAGVFGTVFVRNWIVVTKRMKKKEAKKAAKQAKAERKEEKRQRELALEGASR